MGIFWKKFQKSGMAMQMDVSQSHEDGSEGVDGEE